MSAPSIFFLMRALDTGGAQRQLVELATGLHRQGWRVTVATFYPGGLLESALRAAGVRVLCLDKKGRWDVVPFLWRLIRLVRRERPHFTKSDLGMSNVLLSAVRPALGPVRVVWGVAASDMDLSQYDWLARVEFRLSVALSRFADLIISNSEAGRRYHIAQGYAADRFVVIPNGIDTERFHRDDAGRRALRAEWRVEHEAPLIGLVGRIDPIKDHASFLRAAAQVSAAHARARFVCVGPGAGAYMAQMRELARESGIAARVIWAGEHEDMCRVYNALDLLVSSSVSEGLPNVVAEAMACGVPCVATDVGDSAQLVGDKGWVCAPADSDALARVILEALASPAPDRASIRERICQHYSTTALVRRTIEQLSMLYPDAALENTARVTERRASR